MSSKNLTRLNVSLTASTRQFDQGMDRAEAKTKSFSSQMMKLGGAIAGLLAVGKAVADVNEQFAKIDETAKNAAAWGMTTEALVGLEHAANLSGVSVSELEKAIAKSQRSLGEAALGTGEAAKWIEILGLNVQELQSLAPEQLFEAYADAIAKLPSRAQQVAASAALFADRTGALLPLLQQGSDGIQRLRQEAEDLGIAFSNVQASRIEEANDAISRMEAAFSGAYRVAAIELAPAIEYIATDLTKMMKGNAETTRDAWASIAEVGIGSYEALKQGVLAVNTVATAAILTVGEGLAAVAPAVAVVNRAWEGVKATALGFGSAILDTIGRAVSAWTSTTDLVSRGWAVIGEIGNTTLAGLDAAWQTFSNAAVQAFVYVVDNAMQTVEASARSIADLRIDGVSDQMRGLALAASDARQSMLRTGIASEQSLAAASQAAADAEERLNRAGADLQRGWVQMPVPQWITDASAALSAAGRESANAFFDESGTFTQRILQNIEAFRQQSQQRFVDLAKALAESGGMAGISQRVDAYQAQRAARESQLAADLEMERQHREAILDLDEEAAAKKAEIETKAQAEQAKLQMRQRQDAMRGIGGMFRNLETLQASHNKTAKKIGEAAARARIVTDTAQAAMGAYSSLASIPFVGPALGAAAAAAAIAAGAFQLSQVGKDSISSGGGLSAPGVGAAGAAPGPNTGGGFPSNQIGGGSDRPGRLVIGSGAAIDPVRLAEMVNEAGRRGFVFDGIELA